ncbi:thioredoxin domain-containing protein 5 homolog [Chironomus tepperi]|uniref:thioredoxin domain-containing protein 5 homolog n=1 Tax=Chironomus tepperi TaxID=113505 RepID=UPI00391F8B2A
MKTTVAFTILIVMSHFRLHSCLTANRSDDVAYLAFPIELTDQNFTESVKDNNYLVIFYWSENEISHNIRITMHLLSEIFNANLKIGYIDCNENNQTCLDNGIAADISKSYVLKLYKVNEVEDITYTNDSDYIHYVMEFIQDNLDLPATDQNVVELTDKNFKELTSNGSWIVDFYFPWCIHAKNLEPTLDKLSSVLEQDASVNIGKIDCVKYEWTTCKENFIVNSPTILWFENGRRTDRFHGRPSLKTLKSFVENQLASKKSN